MFSGGFASRTAAGKPGRCPPCWCSTCSLSHTHLKQLICKHRLLDTIPAEVMRSAEEVMSTIQRLDAEAEEAEAAVAGAAAQDVSQLDKLL